jgi:hypothetical protein
MGENSGARRRMITSNRIVENELDENLQKLETKMDATLLAFYGSILYGVDKEIRDAVENLDPKIKRPKLIVVLETPGGYIEVVERIVGVLRTHFDLVEFLIPDHAMSAGTVLAMSGDAVHMDYFSILGPIDPQVERPNSNGMVPALGYLEQYERLVEKSRAGNLTTAELSYLVEKFDPAELYSFEQAREQSIALLKDWLVKYKFKNWDKTETRGITVTKKMKTDRAASIAKKLNETKKWHSHGRGISKEILQNDLKLVIDDFGADPDLHAKVRSYDKLFSDYMMRIGKRAAIHTVGRYIPLTS